MDNLVFPIRRACKRQPYTWTWLILVFMLAACGPSPKNAIDAVKHGRLDSAIDETVEQLFTLPNSISDGVQWTSEKINKNDFLVSAIVRAKKDKYGQSSGWIINFQVNMRNDTFKIDSVYSWPTKVERFKVSEILETFRLLRAATRTGRTSESGLTKQQREKRSTAFISHRSELLKERITQRKDILAAYRQGIQDLQGIAASRQAAAYQAKLSALEKEQVNDESILKDSTKLKEMATEVVQNTDRMDDDGFSRYLQDVQREEFKESASPEQIVKEVRLEVIISGLKKQLISDLETQSKVLSTEAARLKQEQESDDELKRKLEQEQLDQVDKELRTGQPSNEVENEARNRKIDEIDNRQPERKSRRSRVEDELNAVNYRLNMLRAPDEIRGSNPDDQKIAQKAQEILAQEYGRSDRRAKNILPYAEKSPTFYPAQTLRELNS